MVDYGPYSSVETLIGLKPVAKAIASNRVKPKLRPRDGLRQSRISGRGMDFEEARPYQPGDDARHIEWRVTARSGKLHTKLFTEEKEKNTLIVVDQRSPMFFGTRRRFKSTLAAEVAALLGWYTLMNKDHIGLLIVGNDRQHFVRPSSRNTQFLHALSSLNEMNHQLTTEQPSTEISFEQISRELSTLAKPGFNLVLVSDFHDFNERASNDLMRLKRHCSVRAIRIYDSWEQQLPNVGNIELLSAKQSLAIDTSADQQNRLYQEQQQQQYSIINDRLKLVDPFYTQLATHKEATEWGQRVIHG